jgi:hypothetical protein
VEHLAATYVRAERNYQSVCHDEDESLAAGAMSDRAFNAGRDKDLAFLALEAHVTKLTPMVTKTGRLLTDEEINALADEAERGYDVTELIKARWE